MLPLLNLGMVKLPLHMEFATTTIRIGAPVKWFIGACGYLTQVKNRGVGQGRATACGVTHAAESCAESQRKITKQAHQTAHETKNKKHAPCYGVSGGLVVALLARLVHTESTGI